MSDPTHSSHPGSLSDLPDDHVLQDGRTVAQWRADVVDDALAVHLTRQPEPRADTEEPEQPAPPTIWEQMGGPMGMIDSGLPVLVFVIVNAITTLTPAIIAALGAGVLIALLRLIRKKPVTQAVAGLFGVGIAAFIAYRTGTAKGFFAFGIWSYLVYGGALLLSILVRRPLIGVIWEGINGRGSGWREDKGLLRRYDWATAVWVLIFAARYLVQDALYDSDQVGWLAAARIGMGYPLWGLGVLLAIWIIRGHRPAATS